MKEVNDLAVSVVEFDKQQPSKMDPFAAYKVVTEVRKAIQFSRKSCNQGSVEVGKLLTLVPLQTGR